ncbi:MAG: C25 family cysteine peptidase, partial [Balneolaceae bacterium]
MRRRHFYFLLLLLILSPKSVLGQELVLEESTATHEVYLLSNPDLKIAPYFELLIPANNSNSIEIFEQDVTHLPIKISEDQINGLALRSSDRIIELKNEGTLKGEKVVNLIIHVARPTDDYVSVIRSLRIKVPKLANSSPILSQRTTRTKVIDSPLASGQWFKIPIPKEGIYELKAPYLSGLGLDLSNIDPRNIQLWGTTGWMLPELNSEEKPELTEIPIIVEGENDGSFDNADRVIFFGNSPHQVVRNGGSFTHEIHPYSNTTYVFLTIGTAYGKRLTLTSPQGTATTTISRFTDFRWKEQELNKAEDRQRSGRFWLGQRIPATAQNIPISILSDTIPGIIPNQPIEVSGRIYSRALRTTSYDVSLNSESVAQLNISRVSGGYLSYNGDAALGRTFRNTITPVIENDVLTMELIMSNGDDGANGFVDYLRLEYERELIAERGILTFFPPSNSSPTELVNFRLSGFNSVPFVFDITNPIAPVQYQAAATGSEFQFKASQDQSRRYFAQSTPYTPPIGELIPPQNLKGITSYPDYIIVTNDVFKPYADELAQYRSNDNLTPLVITQAEILNEFSGGVKDPTAIRNFLKFLWDKAITDGQNLPKYLLLFGDTTYDTKGIVENSFTNHILTYQSPNSLSRIGSYASDDYFGFMDNNEGGFNAGSRIDIGIGRIPSQTRREARTALDKIYVYENPENAGDWQNLFTFAGDDDFP